MMRGAPEWPRLEAALKAGARRATVHLARAGMEIIAAGGALLDEVVRVKRDAPEGRDSPAADPQRIDVE